MDLVAIGVFSFQIILLSCFAFFAFFNYTYGIASLINPRIKRVRHSQKKVAIVIVSYNEEHVLPETIKSCERLSYEDKLIVLSDDSDNPAITAKLIQLAKNKNCTKIEYPSSLNQIECNGETCQVSLDIWESASFVYIHRGSNLGFKGGNLIQVASYLRSRGIELMYLLDADWHPQSDAIERALEALEADENIAFVQTRRITFERHMGLFQRYVALSEEGCYYVDFEGRQVLGHPLLFSGCCTLLRLDAVESVGGFAFAHLTEDLDVTNRLWLAGWKGIYCSDIVNYGEVPFAYSDFRRQQERWSYGTACCLRDYTWRLLRCSHFNWFEKLSAIRQNGYFSTSLLTAAAILQGIATVIWLVAAAGSYSVEYYLYLVQSWRLPLVLSIYGCILSNFVEPLVMILVKKRRLADLVHLPMAVWYAWSVLLSYVQGNVKGLLGIPIYWFRTPKFLRGRPAIFSKPTPSVRLANAALCLALLLFYLFEGYAFGWRDPFALLLIPAFFLAASK
jgi:cellulose synthase/poly-beta-1,6-N-acetylglucosamine synthase-like glycosyltransferase